MAISGVLIAWLFQSKGMAAEADCSFLISGIFVVVALVTITVDAVRSWHAKRRGNLQKQ